MLQSRLRTPNLTKLLEFDANGLINSCSPGYHAALTFSFEAREQTLVGEAETTAREVNKDKVRKSIVKDDQGL